MHDQAREIRDEIWIRGEHGDQDRTQIAHEWVSRHAANWRRAGAIPVDATLSHRPSDPTRTRAVEFASSERHTPP
jgi:hypothetical protein